MTPISSTGDLGGTSSGGCWKAAGITCGALFLLGLVAVFFGVRAVKTEMAHPRRGSIFGAVMETGAAMQDGLQIQRAVVRYKQAHGAYPKALTDLVADGLLDGKRLHSALDPDPNPGHISWTYARPGSHAVGATPLLTLHYPLTLTMGKRGPQTQNAAITIRLDGSASSDAAAPPAFPHA